jgi:uncharacterized lipoprotein YddW (UPF0748 family)
MILSYAKQFTLHCKEIFNTSKMKSIKLFPLLPLLLFLFSCTQAQPIRGTWITNVGSDVLKSKQNINEAVALCKKAGLNNIYVVVWNKGVTMYPSAVVEKYIGIRQDKTYQGRDPIQEIIDAGHQAGIKVHAWFEFGFSYDYNDSTGIWMKKYPHWAGRNNQGNLLQKNKFFWWNSLHPEVQSFMNELVMEVVQKYPIDGIQGDDRLPAMPSEGGYDPTTKELYAAAHGGKAPPQNPKDPQWLQWRADRLSAYIKHLYTQVKKEKPNCVVSWAPSIYPWSKEQYLQDWPAWLQGGYADYILPQLYRYDIQAYERVLKELKTQYNPAFQQKVFPGILTSLGDGYEVKPEMLQQMIQLNRKYGFEGECTFYFETLRRSGIYYR